MRNNETGHFEDGGRMTDPFSSAEYSRGVQVHRGTFDSLEVLVRGSGQGRLMLGDRGKPVVGGWAYLIAALCITGSVGGVEPDAERRARGTSGAVAEVSRVRAEAKAE